MSGPRERRKQLTRNALIRTAHELFVSQGYARTTVDEIAGAVAVSQRTFFRYFANKQEVALALQGMVQERFCAAVREHPAGGAPLDVLRGALDAAWDGIDEAVREIVPIDLYLRMWRVIEETPALAAVHLRRSTEMEERLSAEIARRAGVDPETDPRPHVLVAAFSGVVRLSGRRWGLGGDLSVAAARRLTGAYLDHLGPALAADWRVHLPSPRGPGESLPAERDTGHPPCTPRRTSPRVAGQ